ncbi:hypothetical protein ABB26_14965 [Stenotrophomonas humi]|uniref:Uncharacterized protein n=1 Tax=Stenotrophomonas humi TaxID=405444 RepID=A0A0R0BZP7_9GAMM|nr:hypothetical protein [Stenotrophomonas humi]KRG62768.1 hypothetical protein ABB26_14965 [Stenotrophomonas humi]
MNRISIFPLLLGFVLLSTMFAAPSHAGGVIECNNCPSTRNAAISGGIGLTLVVDFSNARLTAYNVEYDRELRRWRTLPASVPTQISAAFYRVLDASGTVTAPRGSSPPNQGVKEPKTLPRKGDGGMIVTLHPDNPQHSNPLGASFPNAYRDSNAHEIVQSATFKSRLGQQLATDLAGANTDNAAWNSIALSVQKLALNWGEKFGAGAITIVITWRDGSRTTYRITQDNVAEAKYVKGESRDNIGNKIPDETIAQPQTAPEYAGGYYFGEVDAGGSRNLERWMQAAQMYGIPITGSSAGRNRMSCGWDGRTLKCVVR